MRARSSGLAALAHRAFAVGLLAKAAFALVEFLLGLGLFFVGSGTIRAAIRALTIHEIAEDPADPIAGFLLGQAGLLTDSLERFYAVYLSSHGVLKLVMVVLLLRGAIWAYPLGIAILLGFIAYQVGLMASEPRLGLALLTSLDMIVVTLTLLEYRRLRRQT